MSQATVRGGGTAIFGWCLVGAVIGTSASTGQHEACIKVFKSSGTGKTYVCQCSCHQTVRKDLEEMI